MLDLLPEDVLNAILIQAGGVSELGAFERTSKARVSEVVWEAHVRKKWGPVSPQDAISTWRMLARELNLCVRPLLSTDVATAVTRLTDYLLQGTTWHDTFRCCLCGNWCSVLEKRRIVSFICSRQDSCVLKDFLGPLPIRGSNPLSALRDFLLVFPFLPIDAGAGADRVIGKFARAFARQNPEALEPLGLAMASERAARDLLYTLIYSIIMLSTDLHSPRVYPKITADEYIRSCHRCPHLRDISAAYLHDIYRDISEAPLTIVTSSDPAVALSRELQQPMPIFGAVAADRGVAAGAAVVVGGRDPLQPVAVDWVVAYYNVLDLLRWVRAEAWKWVYAADGSRGRCAAAAVAVLMALLSLSYDP